MSRVLRLIHLDGTKAGRTDAVDFAPLPDQTLTLGRDPSCILSYDPYADPRVSAHHADIVWEDDAFWLLDRGSTNGTRINGLKIFERSRLKSGDEVELGRKGARFRVEIEAEDGSARRNGTAAIAAKTPDPAPRTADDGSSSKPNAMPTPPRTDPSSRAAAGRPALAAVGNGGKRIDVGEGHDVGQKTMNLILRNASDLSKREGGGSITFMREVVRQVATESSAGVRAWLIGLTLFLLVVFGVLTTMLIIFASELQQQRVRANEADLEVDELRARLDDEQSRQHQLERELERRLDDSAQQLSRRLEEVSDEVRRNMEARLEMIAQAERQFEQTHRSERSRFRDMHERYMSSVFLVVSQIQLVNAAGHVVETKTNSGTGFVITQDGHLVTNKHVIQPWKFGELAARIEAEELTVGDRDVFAWPTNTIVLGHDRRTLRDDTSFSTRNRRLAIDRVSPDRWERIPFARYGERRVHRTNDNHDLAILKISDSNFDPVPVWRPSHGDSWRPRQVDPIMVVGFPRGTELFDGMRASTQPVLGDIRNIDETITISAPIFAGNSGGPVFTIDTERDEPVVIGIATRVVSGTEALGICIRIHHALALIDE